MEAEFWGRWGAEVVEEMERALGVQFGGELREFGTHVGNFSVSPFEIIVCGARNERVETSCVTARQRTREVRKAPHDFIEIMRNAGVIYCSVAPGDRVVAYDA